ETTWKVPRPRHDVHLVALAIGPGVASPHWQTAKPYQPTSPEWTPYTLGCSGAVWLDGDGDGRCSCARDYAERLFVATGGKLAKLTNALGDYDAATAAHAAQLYRAAGGSLLSEEFAGAQKNAAPRIQAGFRAYVEAWRENEQARAAR
ncbi:MAG TPA: hypothetical protein VL096_15135, partial [Pirellulaceae bacterium]|nr:hypothetical protein [Pirellulaceae bacterium]